MGYTSKQGRRPNEYASKSSHSHIIKDETVKDFLLQCAIRPRDEDFTLDDRQIDFEPIQNNPIRHIIAVDGGYTEVPITVDFPSAKICFFQIGALFFSIEDLENLDEQAFIDPSDMAKLNNIQRLKFTLPIHNINLQDESTLTRSIRRTIYNFFNTAIDDSSLMETLSWLIFQEFSKPVSHWVLGTCPVCDQTSIPLSRSKMSKNYTFECPHCQGEIFLTDTFRLHEVIDDELGAGGILGYVVTTIEQLVMVHLIRLILRAKPALLNEILFVKDGPLAFFGQTANLHKPMRALVNYLFDHHNLYMVGLEKSGAFVDHAHDLRDVFEENSILFIDNEYIYKRILPGKADPANPYGKTTYYSNKLIFKTASGLMFVASLPTRQVLSSPVADDFINLQAILTNLEMLRCDMYDNALIPIALANKLVSLANHPSSTILRKFAIGTMRTK